jgi:4-amino-4-deoxy-L-arabinose transferase-like glycosyltransferase
MFPALQNRPGQYALLTTVAAGLCFLNLGEPSLWDIDEAHNAEAAREMMVSGNWVVPTFNYQLRSDKPALLYWLQIAAYGLFGVNEFTARFPSALASLGTVLVSYELGRRLFSASTGLIAGLVLASTLLFSAAAHFANPDAVLLVCTTSSLFFFWRSFARADRRWFVPASICSGLAVLAKGPVGLVLPLAVTVSFLLWSGQLRLLWDRRFLLAIFAFLLMVLPWYIWVTAESKFVFPREFFLLHNAGRFRAVLEGHHGPVYYYLICLVLGLGLWSAFLGPVCAYALGQRARADQVRDSRQVEARHRRDLRRLPSAYRFLWCWIAVYLAFFSLSATKLPNYILPIFPPVALLTARFLDRWRRREIAPPGWVVTVSLACLALVGIGAALALLLAGGAVTTPVLRGSILPGLEAWAVLGIVPVLGAGAGWWCARRQWRDGLVASVAGAATAFTGALAAGGSVALDHFKSARPLVQIVQAHQTEREVRVGLYGYYQPSLVFYVRREVQRLEEEADALEFLRYPIPVYLFMPAPVWQGLEPKVQSPHQVLARHHDLYKGCDVVVVSNR